MPATRAARSTRPAYVTEPPGSATATSSANRSARSASSEVTTHSPSYRRDIRPPHRRRAPSPPSRPVVGTRAGRSPVNLARRAGRIGAQAVADHERELPGQLGNRCLPLAPVPAVDPVDGAEEEHRRELGVDVVAHDPRPLPLADQVGDGAAVGLLALRHDLPVLRRQRPALGEEQGRRDAALHQVDDVLLDQAAELRQRVVVGLAHRVDRPDEPLVGVLHQLEEEALLGVHVVVDAAAQDPEPARDVGGRGRLVAVLEEELARRLEHLRPTLPRRVPFRHVRALARARPGRRAARVRRQLRGNHHIGCILTAGAVGPTGQPSTGQSIACLIFSVSSTSVVEEAEVSKVDVVVIGAGAAGLTTGALLAKQGKKVVVLDKSPHLGGRGMAVPDEGFKLNVGGHLLEDSGSGITKVFEHLGKHLGHGPVSTDMPVWDHTTDTWGSIRDRYSGNKDELKKVIKALMDTPFEEFEKWDDRSLREWMLQYTTDQGVIDLWEFLAVLECLTDEWWDHSASDNLYVRQDALRGEADGRLLVLARAGLGRPLPGPRRRGHRERRRGADRHRGRAGDHREPRGQGRRRRTQPADPAERDVRGGDHRVRRRRLDAAGLERARASCPSGSSPTGTPARSSTSRSRTTR